MKKNITILAIMLIAIASAMAHAFDSPYDPVTNPAAAQSYAVSRDFIPASPTVAGLGLYGNIPVGNFTGTAQIEVPIYNFNYKDLSVPVSLTYHASGVKPDNFPGLVGLGWTLQAGGCITRVVNGTVDYGPQCDQGDNAESLDDFRYDFDAWSSSSYLNIHIITQTMQIAFQPQSNPDKYIFNINGQCGSFYEGQRDTFKICSQTGEYYNVTFVKSSVPTGNTYSPIINSITMIDSRGVKYVFGDGSVEWSHAGLNYLLYTVGVKDLFQVNTQSAWYLKYIESPNGYRIDFTYDSYYSLNKIRFTDFSVVSYAANKSIPQESKYYDNQKWNLTHGLCISKISSPAGKIEFTHSTANAQLNYPQFTTDLNDFIYLQNSNGHSRLPESLPHKIDSIIISNNSDELARYHLQYTNSTSTRLKLLSVKRENASGNVLSEYDFEYNQTPLPAYMSGMTDHYGFYNGKSFFSDQIQDTIHKCFNLINNSAYVEELKSMINSAKQPDTTLVMAELLEKITYPTGGYTVLDYEPHFYGKKFQTWPFQVVDNADGNRLTSGVRIKSVKNFGYDGALLSEKIYHYEKNYLTGGSLSSGILTYTPEYVESFINKYRIYGNSHSQYLTSFFRVTSNPMFPLMPMSNHITYSEVTVEEPGNGFTVYKYKNFDNGYCDSEPLAYASNILADNTTGTSGIVEYWKNDEGISMELERGQVISEEIYDKDKVLKKKIENTYNDDSERFNDNVRFIRYEANGYNISGFRSFRISSGYYYTYYPYLKEKKVTDYFGQGNTLSSEVFTYNEQLRLLKTTTACDSKNVPYENRIKYVCDYTTEPYATMKSLGIFSPVVENEQYRNGNFLQKTATDYFNWGNNLFAPQNIKGQTAVQSNPETRIVYTSYDSYGNPRSAVKDGAENIAWVWSYGGQYPVAEINMGSYTYQQIEEAVESAFSVSSLDALAEQNTPNETALRTGALQEALPDALVTTYTYKPLVGVRTVTSPNKVVTTYNYDAFGRLQSIVDGANKTVESYDYHYKN
jgi:YD repeat-containing protein